MYIWCCFQILLRQYWIQEAALIQLFINRNWQCQKLTVLRMDGNLLGVKIPVEISQLNRLAVLDLSANQNFQEIPVELGKLSKLLSISLKDNRLSVQVQAEIAELYSLTLSRSLHEHAEWTNSISHRRLHQTSTVKLWARISWTGLILVFEK